MDWTDEGIFLSAKPLGEANAVAELFTLGHGRHLGLVRGGRSRRVRPLLQPGNLLRVTWRARLSEHLGGFNVELLEAHAARVLDDAAALAAIGVADRARAASARARPASRALCGDARHLARLRGCATSGRRCSCAGSCSCWASSASASISANARRPAPTPISFMSRRARAGRFRATPAQPYCDRLLKLPRLPAR